MQPHVRAFVERAVTFHDLPGLRRHAAQPRRRASSRIAGVNIADVCAMQITDLADWVARARRAVGGPAARRRSSTRWTPSSRSASATCPSTGPPGTLSGGEAQRTKMIRHLGSSLTDVTYVFDEPTIGLHPHDIARMNQLLLRLRDKGNTVLVVEHKPEAIAIADHVVDLGPGRGDRRAARSSTRGPSRGCAAATPSPGATSTTGPRSSRRCGRAAGSLEIRGAATAQPARRRRRRPARRALRRHGRRGLGQELARPRLARAGATASSASTRARSAARGGATPRPTPACWSRSARRSRRPTASSRRCSAPTPRAPARRATAPGSSTPTWA